MKTIYTLLILIIPFIGISQTVYVTNTNNEGPGSFRDAVENASSGTTVTFDNSLLGQTIYLYDIDVQIYSEITIKGIIENDEYVTINLGEDIWYYDAVVIEDIRMTKSVGGNAYLNNYVYNNNDVTLINSIFENFDNSLMTTGSYQLPSGSRIFIDNCIFNNCSGIINTNNGASNYDSVIVINSNFNFSNSSSGFDNTNTYINNCNLNESSLNVSGLNVIISNTDIDNGLYVNADNQITIHNCNIDNNLSLNTDNNTFQSGININELIVNVSDLYIDSESYVLITNSEFNSQSSNNPYTSISANEIEFYGNLFNDLSISFNEPFDSQSNTNLIIDSCYFYDSEISISNFEDITINNSLLENLSNDGYNLSYTNFNNLLFYNSTFNFPNISENSQSFNLYNTNSSTVYIENSTIESPYIFQFSGDQNWDFTLYNSTLNGRIRFITQNLFTFNSYNSIIKEIKDLYNDFPDSEQYISDIDYNSYGYNLIGDLSAEMTNIDDTDIINIDIDLMPLDYYGGHTKTMPPNECSPALDAGDPQSTDISQNQLLPIGVKDIGAAERNIEIVRYNCENGNCIIVNDASGQFCTLNECEQVCQNISSISENIIDINIYPNPSSNIFNLEFNSDNETEMSVTNILGEQVYFESTKSIGEFNTQIDLSNYSKGVYNLTIKTSDGLSNHKLILQ